MSFSSSDTAHSAGRYSTEEDLSSGDSMSSAPSKGPSTSGSEPSSSEEEEEDEEDSNVSLASMWQCTRIIMENTLGCPAGPTEISRLLYHAKGLEPIGKPGWSEDSDGQNHKDEFISTLQQLKQSFFEQASSKEPKPDDRGLAIVSMLGDVTHKAAHPSDSV